MRESSPRGAAPHGHSAALQELHRGRAFVGREDQLAEIRSVARAVREGEPWVVLVEGAAGIGKSALLARAIAGLDGFTVIRAYGAREEADLNYGLMGQLWTRLPSPTLAGETTPFAPDLAHAPTPVQVGARLLKALGELESRGPVAIVIDDLQWSDKASAQALGFVLRRLYADPVLTLLAARIGPDLVPVQAGVGWRAHADESIAAAEAAPGWAWLAGRELLVRLRLGGLDTRDVRELARLGDITLAEAEAERLRAHTDGNPLHLSTVLADATQSTFSAAGLLPVPASLISALDRQLTTLPADSRAVLEALAVLGARSPLSTVGDLAGVTDPAGALDQLIANGLIRWYPNDPIASLEIPHPLQCDAVYASIRPTRRRELHAHAAEVVPRAAAWSHRVSARDRTDPKLAAELEAEVANLVESGQLDRAATMLLWAASLSSDRADFERRTLTAALNLWLDHRMARFKTLRAQIESCAASVVRDLVMGLFHTGAGEPEPAMRAMRAAFAGAIEPGAAPEAAFAAVAGHLLSAASTWTGDDLDQATQIARSALAMSTSNLVMSLRLERTVPFTIFLQHGPAAALADIAHTAMATDPAEVTARFGHLLLLRGGCRAMAGELQAGRADLERALTLADSTPIALGNMEAHFWLAQTHYLLGSWPEAQMHAEHSIAIAQAEEVWWGHQQAYMIHSLAAGGRGDATIAEESARKCRQWFDAMGPRRWLVFSCLAAGALAISREDIAAALEALESLPAVRDQAYTRTWELFWAPLLAEAQIGAAALDEAADTLGRIAALTADVALLRPALAWLTGRLAEARGDTTAADRAYAAGLAIPPHADDAPYYRARLEHADGRLLTTLGNPKTAAELLRSAHQRFTAMDARPYLDRVDTDLAELRIPIPTSGGDHLRELTDRERDVARLVADGLTNAQAAARLYLSNKTIEYHLAHIYSKLGITTRRQLRELTRTG